MNSYGVTIQMKPLQQYFHTVLFIQYVVLTFESVVETLLSIWMKSYGVIVQMKATKQYNHEVQFIMMYKMVLACKYTTLKKNPKL